MGFVHSATIWKAFLQGTPCSQKPFWGEVSTTCFLNICFHDPNYRVYLFFKMEVEQFRAQKEITMKGVGIPKPIVYFEEAHLPGLYFKFHIHLFYDKTFVQRYFNDFLDFVMNTIRKQNWTQPTAIQAQGLPIGLSGRDCVGIARTGSGKTVAVCIKSWLFSVWGMIEILREHFLFSSSSFFQLWFTSCINLHCNEETAQS